MNEKLRNQIIELLHLIEKNGRPARLGKTFSTDKNYYYYDAGTGKVAKLKVNVYMVLKCILEKDDPDEVMKLSLNTQDVKDAIFEIRYAMREENILQAPPVKTLTGEAVKNLDDILETMSFS